MNQGKTYSLFLLVPQDNKKKKSEKDVSFNFFAPMAESGKRMGEKGYNMLLKMLVKNNIEKKMGKKNKLFEKSILVDLL